MFLAAFTSALQAYPQEMHRKAAWLSRDFRSTCPHAEHRWLVNTGLTFSTRPGALLLDREVPHVPSMRAVIPQHRFLGGRGKKTIPGHANTLSIDTDISREVTRRFPGLRRGSVYMPRSL